MVFFANYLFIIIIFVSVIFLLLQKRDIQKQILLFSFVSLPFVFILAKILSYLYYSPRPFVVHHFTPLVFHAPNNGFPSDHAILTFSLATIVFVFNRKWGFAIFFLGLLVGIGRIYVGIHSVIDVFGGFLISSGVVIAVHLSIMKLRTGLKKNSTSKNK